jgi:hypothetical protein
MRERTRKIIQKLIKALEEEGIREGWRGREVNIYNNEIDEARRVLAELEESQ